MANQHQLRKLLWQYPNGLTVKEAADMLDDNISNTAARLKSMVDTYIIGWTTGRPRALWAVVVTPPNCPRPLKQKETIDRHTKGKKQNVTPTPTI